MISLTSVDFSSLVDARDRPYNFVFLLTANYLMDKPQLQLRKLRKNFGVAAKAHKAKVEGTGDAGRSADCGQCSMQGWRGLPGCDHGRMLHAEPLLHLLNWHIRRLCTRAQLLRAHCQSPLHGLPGP